MTQSSQSIQNYEDGDQSKKGLEPDTPHQDQRGGVIAKEG